MPTVQLSLRNKLTLAFAAVTVAAIGGLYLYVVPGLQARLLTSRLLDLAAAGERTAAGARTSRRAAAPGVSQALVSSAAARSSDRVTLLAVSPSRPSRRARLITQADSRGVAAEREPVAVSLAERAAETGRVQTGTQGTSGGRVAAAAVPVVQDGRVETVIVHSAPTGDIVRNVAVVRHEILVAGALALVVAVAAGYLIARALSQRVKRLERAAQQMAAGTFEHAITIDSLDELGQLGVAFNIMQRQLAQLEEARKKFIATASHELRTPIFSLGGFVELLEDDELDADTRQRFLEQVKVQVERLGKLSVDLLDLSRLESGALELRPEEVDVCELTRSVAGEFEPTLVQHDSHLELRLASRRLEAQCDPVRVAQIVRILIDNALTHTPAGTRIVLTAGRDDGYIRLDVTDDGDGIAGEALPRIFERFYTADDAQGSGLGLAIASELAGRMSGRLSVHSAPGETVFTLELPA